MYVVKFSLRAGVDLPLFCIDLMDYVDSIDDSRYYRDGHLYCVRFDSPKSMILECLKSPVFAHLEIVEEGYE